MRRDRGHVTAQPMPAQRGYGILVRAPSEWKADGYRTGARDQGARDRRVREADIRW